MSLQTDDEDWLKKCTTYETERVK